MDESLTIALPVGVRDHVRGPASALVTLVEYGDFECAHCGTAYPIVKELLQRRFGDQLRVVFRHFPLTNVHPQAQAAAEAAEWAGSQGAFWEMHDALYEQQTKLSDGHLLRLAQELNLDAESLQRGLNEHTFFARVKEDFLGGIKSGVKGTPAFFVNEVRHEGAWDIAALLAVIDRAAAPK